VITLTEVLPASKTSPNRAVRYSPVCAGVGVVVIEDKRSSTRYAVAVQAFGGVRFTKTGGDENYAATVTSCECKGWLFSKSGTPCKHIECVRSLLANRWLEHDGRETVSDKHAEAEHRDAYYAARGI
jgi:hypothetical protein